MRHPNHLMGITKQSLHPKHLFGSTVRGIMSCCMCLSCLLCVNVCQLSAAQWNRKRDRRGGIGSGSTKCPALSGWVSQRVSSFKPAWCCLWQNSSLLVARPCVMEAQFIPEAFKLNQIVINIFIGNVVALFSVRKLALWGSWAWS